MSWRSKQTPRAIACGTVEGEEAIVVAAAAAEAVAVAGKGEAGDEDEGDLGGGDDLLDPQPVRG